MRVVIGSMQGRRLDHASRTAPADLFISFGDAPALMRGGVRVEVGLRLMRMLVVLLTPPGRVVSGDELVAAIWSDVEDGGPETARQMVSRKLMAEARVAALALGVSIRNCGPTRGFMAEAVRPIEGAAYAQ